MGQTVTGFNNPAAPALTPPNAPVLQAGAAEVSRPVLEPNGSLRAQDLIQTLPHTLRTAALDGTREARIQLWPPELGSIHVHLRLDGNRVFAHLAAERLQVRAMLEGMRTELNRSMREAGLTLERLEIDAGQGLSAFARESGSATGASADQAARAWPAANVVTTGQDVVRREFGEAPGARAEGWNGGQHGSSADHGANGRSSGSNPQSGSAHSGSNGQNGSNGRLGSHGDTRRDLGPGSRLLRGAERSGPSAWRRVDGFDAFA